MAPTLLLKTESLMTSVLFCSTSSAFCLAPTLSQLLEVIASELSLMTTVGPGSVESSWKVTPAQPACVWGQDTVVGGLVGAARVRSGSRCCPGPA